MKKLNISIFIQTMQVGLKEHDTQFAVALNKPDEGFEIYYEDTVMKGRNPFYKDNVMHEFSKVLGDEFKKRKRTLRRPMP